jgi:acyl carrier protein
MGMAALEIALTIEETFGVSFADELFLEPDGRALRRTPPDITVGEIIAALTDVAAQSSRVLLPASAPEQVRRIVADKLNVSVDRVEDHMLLVKDLGA